VLPALRPKCRSTHSPSSSSTCSSNH
jgi:hypothetical protein